ncbi:MAG: MCE family protein [Deltaproteobacteria bacterium]|nr:MCE family protein [Deltaproteobacteria bacterium]
MALSNEIKIGSFVTGTVLLAVIFAWAIGVQNPFDRTFDFYVTYNFAGGIEVGSPVRVSGIKVGKVEKIDFYVQELQSAQNAIALKEPGSAESPKDKAVYPVRLQISVKREAIKAIRKDSRFYINLAGIIGERYIEITPGSLNSPLLRPDEVIAGIDPPRIDQLISQSFDLFGKIKEVIQENKGDIAKSIEHLYKLSENLNKTLGWIEKSNLFKTDLSKLTNNLIAITADVKKLTERVNSPEGEKTLKLLYDLLWRLEPLNSEEIHKFFQKEGIRARIF